MVIKALKTSPIIIIVTSNSTVAKPLDLVFIILMLSTTLPSLSNDKKTGSAF